MEVSISKASASAHRVTARAMLGVEAAALRLLQQVVRDATEGRSPTAAAKALQGPVAAAVNQAQDVARRVGKAQLQAELDALAPELRDAGAPRVVVPDLARPEELDRVRAERAASSLSAAYLTEVERSLKGADRVRALWGSRAVQIRMELDAATEVSVAFNEERLRAERAIRARHAGTNWLPALLKQWNATNDRRLCPRCSEKDGKLRPIGLDFGGLIPGVVHPRCRCFAAIVFAPIYLGRDEADDA